jgi:hypothetical protein
MVAAFLDDCAFPILGFIAHGAQLGQLPYILKQSALGRVEARSTDTN